MTPPPPLALPLPPPAGEVWDTGLTARRRRARGLVPGRLPDHAAIDDLPDLSDWKDTP